MANWEEYDSVVGLSNSGISDLAISPLRYWHKHLNPNRIKDEPTAEMLIGTAVHHAVLEPHLLDSLYACEVNPSDYQDLLVTVDDIRSFIRDKGSIPKGTKKADLIYQARSIDKSVSILEVIESDHATLNIGKTIFKLDDWSRVVGASRALLDEPLIMEALARGSPEVVVTRTCEDTGIQLKGKLDWVLPNLTVDVKTFSQKRGKSIDQSIADAIYYEQYYRQVYFYALLRGWPADFTGRTMLAFVESVNPHEVRLKRLSPKTGQQANLYWTKAILEVRGCIRIYAECMNHFGPDKPWRYAQQDVPLQDEEMKGMAF